jgi:hypothetical protein
LVLIGPQHGAGFTPKQQSLHSLAKCLSLEIESIVNFARTKTSSSLVHDQPAMAVVYFCHFYKSASKQLSPSRKDFVICFAETELKVGTSAFDSYRYRPANVKIANLQQYTVCRVKLGYSAIHANAASRLPPGSQEQWSHARRDVHQM